MYPAIIFILITVGILSWRRQNVEIQSLRGERDKTREELFAHAEEEIIKIGSLNEIIAQLRDCNAHLECVIQERSSRIVERDRDLQVAKAENEVLCMKLARAVWQNRNGAEPHLHVVENQSEGAVKSASSDCIR